MKFPPLPNHIYGPDGRKVPVIVMALPSKTEVIHGQYNPEHDQIEINERMELELQWHSFIHEKIHCWMWKLGLSYAIDNERLEDQICQGLATAEIAHMRRLLGGRRGTT